MTKTIWLAAAAPLVLSAPAPAHGCSCLPPPSPCATYAEKGAVIFVGTPVSKAPVDLALDGVVAILVPRGREIPDSESGTLFKFRVDEWLQGRRPGEVVAVASGNGTCAYRFALGTSYLVYAYPGSDELRVSGCTRTGPVTWRRDDLALLREMRSGAPRPRLAGSLQSVVTRLDGTYGLERSAGPVSGVRILADGVDGRLEAVTDREGMFSFGPVAAGEYRVSAEVPAGAAAVWGPATRPVTVGSCLDEVGFAMTRTRLAGTARTAEGVGQPSVQVTAVRVEAGRAPDVTRSVFVYSDESGQWAFNGLRAGRYLVGLNVFGPPTPRSPWPTTWYPGVARAADAQVLDVTDAVAAPIEFRMPAALASQTIEGTVVDSTGRPVTGANVNLYDRADKRQSASHATTDTSGRFTIARLPGRQYDIEALLVIWGGPSPRTRRRLPEATDTRPVRLVLPGVVDRTKSPAGAGG